MCFPRRWAPRGSGLMPPPRAPWPCCLFLWLLGAPGQGSVLDVGFALPRFLGLGLCVPPFHTLVSQPGFPVWGFGMRLMPQDWGWPFGGVSGTPEPTAPRHRLSHATTRGADSAWRQGGGLAGQSSGLAGGRPSFPSAAIARIKGPRSTGRGRRPPAHVQVSFRGPEGSARPRVPALRRRQAWSGGTRADGGERGAGSSVSCKPSPSLHSWCCWGVWGGDPGHSVA